MICCQFFSGVAEFSTEQTNAGNIEMQETFRKLIKKKGAGNVTKASKQYCWN